MIVLAIILAVVFLIFRRCASHLFLELIIEISLCTKTNNVRDFSYSHIRFIQQLQGMLYADTI